MNHRLWIRIALGYLAVVALQVGLWAQFAPRSFYDRFPGMGGAWVALDGPYNEHLIRDVGGLNLALAILLIAAIYTLSRPIIITACLAALAYGTPHLVYHLANTEPLSTSDVIASIGGLILFAGLPLLVIRESSKIVAGSLPDT